MDRMSQNNLTEDGMKVFDNWRTENATWLNQPTIVSLLYDMNRLPEVVLTFQSASAAHDLINIVEHFKMFAEEMKEKA